LCELEALGEQPLQHQQDLLLWRRAAGFGHDGESLRANPIRAYDLVRLQAESAQDAVLHRDVDEINSVCLDTTSYAQRASLVLYRLDGGDLECLALLRGGMKTHQEYE